MSDSNAYSQVLELLRAESEAIAKAAARLQAAELDRVRSSLGSCKGKIVLLGVGKSGIIAQKIAATMTSSGTAAIHLHPRTLCTAAWEFSQLRRRRHDVEQQRRDQRAPRAFALHQTSRVRSSPSLGD